MLIQELEDRFNTEKVSGYPRNRCDDLLEADPTKLPTEVCPPSSPGQSASPWSSSRGRD